MITQLARAVEADARARPAIPLSSRGTNCMVSGGMWRVGGACPCNPMLAADAPWPVDCTYVRKPPKTIFGLRVEIAVSQGSAKFLSQRSKWG